MPILLPKGPRLAALLRLSPPDLVRPVACWKAENGGWIVSLPDSESEKRLTEIGATAVKRPRRSPSRGPADWVELVDLIPAFLPEPWDMPTLLVVEDRSVALGLVSQILCLGHVGVEIGRLGDQVESPYLIMGTCLPMFVVLGQIGAPGVTVLLDSSRRGVWIPAGMDHPLADRIAVPSGRWILLLTDGTWNVLERPKLTPADTLARFGLNEAVPCVVGAWSEHIKIPLRLVASHGSSEAVAWLSYTADRNALDQWISEARPEELSAYQFAVLQMAEPVVMLRLRPGKQELRSSRPPAGLALGGVRGLDGVYMPCDKEIVPLVGLALLRKAIGAQSGAVRLLLEDGGEGAFRIISVPDGEGDFQLLSNWVDYVVDRDAEMLAIWKGRHEFDFDAIIREFEPAAPSGLRMGGSKPELEPDLTPVPIRTSKGIKGSKSSKSTVAKPTDVATPAIRQETAVTVAAVPSVAPSIDQAALKLKYNELIEDFWSGQESLYSDRRCSLMEELADISSKLGNPAEAARLQAVLAWCQPSQERLDQWFRAEQVVLGCGPVVGLEEWVSPIDLNRTPERYWAVWMAGQTVGQPSEPVMNHLREACRSNVWPLRHSWWCAQSLSRCAGGDTLLLAEVRDRLVRRLAGDLRPTGDLPQLMVDRMGELGAACGTFHGRLIREVICAFLEGLEQGTTVFGIPGDAKWVVISLGYAAQSVGLALAGDGLVDEAQAKSVGAWHHVTRVTPPPYVVAAGAAKQAYAFRCDQAKRQSVIRGPLPTELEPKGKAHAASGANFIYQTFREMSRLLEPDQRINAFAVFLKSESASLQRLREAPDDAALRSAFDACIEELIGSATVDAQYLNMALVILERAAVLDEGRAIRALKALERLNWTGQAFGPSEGIERWVILSAAISLACHWNLPVEELLQRGGAEMAALAGTGSFSAISGFLGKVSRRMLACGRSESLQAMTRIIANTSFKGVGNGVIPIDRERSQLAVEAHLEGVHLALGMEPSPLFWERFMGMDSKKSPHDLASRTATVGLLDAVVSLGALVDGERSRQCDDLCLNLLRGLAGETNSQGSQLFPGCVSGTMRGIEAILAPSGLTTMAIRQEWILDETEASLRARVFREYAQALAEGQES